VEKNKYKKEKEKCNKSGGIWWRGESSSSEEGILPTHLIKTTYDK